MGKGFQDWMERNVFLMLLLLLIAGVLGTIGTVVPLFVMKGTYEDVGKFPELQAVRPYNALELAGRDIYIREGCYNCHSQMVRPFRDEMMRYGHYSLAVESRYDHPFQWGSKRTGPDLARVGGKYSDEWHRSHMMRPQNTVPESIMPAYPWLADAKVDAASLPVKMKALRMIGVPYTDAEIDGAAALVGDATEMDAIIAYLQVLGTMVKFEPGKAYRE